MRKRLVFIAAFLLIFACASTLLYAQYSYNQNPTAYGSSDIVTGNTATGNRSQSQLSYRSTSGSNTSYGMSGLNSFMRNSSQGDSLAKYLTNNTSNSTGISYRSNSLSNQSAASTPQNGTGISSYINSSSNNRTQAGTTSQNKSGLSSLPGMSGSSSSVQNLLSDYNIQTNTRTQTGSDDISQRLENITEQLNSLQQKLENGNYNKNSASSNNMQRYIGNSRTTEIAAPSEFYSGIGENSSAFGIMSSPLGVPGTATQNSVRGTQYEPGYIKTGATEQSSYDSLDEIKAKLDEMSKSIDTHLQSNKDNSENYEQKYTSTRTEQQYSSFQSYSQSQFDKYFSTAQEQLMRGNYYEAADSFTLASVYEPENPNCYAGQGHALFAAGQFISSALYIIRAIELNPDYIQANIDLAAVTGSRDIIYLRTNELENLLKKAPASGLQILAAYVYYRTGKLMDAREIINAVYQETPNSRAALALKIAIETKLNYSR